MSPRRLMGRTCAAGFGVAAVATLISSCGVDTDPVGVDACAELRAPHVRVDDARCDRGEPGVGRYVMQLPETTYEYDASDDDYYPVYQPILVPNVGSPLPFGAPGSARSGFVPAPAPDPKQPGSYSGFGRTTRVPAVAAPGAAGAVSGPGSTAGSTGSSISRGGLGVSGSSSSPSNGVGSSSSSAGS